MLGTIFFYPNGFFEIFGFVLSVSLPIFKMFGNYDDYNPFDAGILSVMTQREENNRSPINAYWEKIESYSQVIPMQESGDEYDVASNDPWSQNEVEEEIDVGLEEDFVPPIERNIYVGTQEQFLFDYNDTVNRSVEEYLLEAQNYDDLTKDCNSPLFEFLVEKVCSLDDLKVGPKADKTYDSSRTAIRSFNFWWKSHNFNIELEPTLYNIRAKYGDMLDGFQALCTASHQERNVMLAHYVTKMIKRVEVKEGEVDFVLGRTKRIYLNGLQRGMHMYEHEHELTLVYGDWTWTKSKFYTTTKAMLKKVTTEREVAVSPSKLDKSADYMTDEQFDALHEFTWNLSENPALPFSKQLAHKQAHFIQGLCKFECLRGRDDLANCMVKEFVICEDQEDNSNTNTLQHDEILFQMKRDHKSMKLGSDFSVNHKESLLLKGTRYKKTLTEILRSPRPTNLACHLMERIFLKPKSGVVRTSTCYWQAKVQGKTFCEKVVSGYVKLLEEQKHPLFMSNERFTNSSIRKYHVSKLDKSGAPVTVQQASLAQNTRFYNKGPKSERMARKRKVASIVGGDRTVWHSPTLDTARPEMYKSVPAALSSVASSVNLDQQPVCASSGKKIRFSFQTANANINFEYDV